MEEGRSGVYLEGEGGQLLERADGIFPELSTPDENGSFVAGENGTLG